MYDLSPEIILCIFKYCDFTTLCRLRETCKYLNEVVTNNRIFYEDALLTNQINKKFQGRLVSVKHDGSVEQIIRGPLFVGGGQCTCLWTSGG